MAKHNMKVTRFWVDADASKDRLYHVLEHPDMASRERNYKAFMEDPEWLDLRKRTELGGVLYECIGECLHEAGCLFPRLILKWR